MNEKFFDLKKEKQDRIMGAAMEMFAESGYEHASTDDMVKRAHISKGLLFHYFGSKLGLYSFLYDYCVRFLTLEYSRNVPKEETDFFRLQDALLAAWADAIRQYPYIRLFLNAADRETDRDAVREIEEKRKAYHALTEEVQARCGSVILAQGVAAKDIAALIRYTFDGMFSDADRTANGWQETCLSAVRAMTEQIKRLTYVEKEDTRDE